VVSERVKDPNRVKEPIAGVAAGIGNAGLEWSGPNVTESHSSERRLLSGSRHLHNLPRSGFEQSIRELVARDFEFLRGIAKVGRDLDPGIVERLLHCAERIGSVRPIASKGP
jgi:hypothetical protein